MNSIGVQEPPVSLKKRLGFLGPGLILSASIVGSGELIATTVLGAKAGFVTFWVILLSCLVKVAVQLEFGKNAILSGRPLMEEFNRFGGPGLGKANWAVWAVFILTLFKILQLGGMLGGASIILSLVFPQIPVPVWVVLSGLSLSLFVYKNKYFLIEKTATVLVFGFTIFTLVSLVALFFTPFAFSWEEVRSGLEFKLPREAIWVAIGAFGITGVASDEIIAYTYWCQEKGYSKYVGPNDGSEAWRNRADGWLRVMYLDSFLAMVVYTIVTAAFYLLGAAVLHGQDSIPDGNDLIVALAGIYTETLGNGAKLGYLAGGFFALYSSVFATLAYWSRLLPDVFVQFGWIKASKDRGKWVAILAWALPAIWALTFLFVKLPGVMIISGGVVGSVLLWVVVWAAIKFRAKNRSLKLLTGPWTEAFFWVSVAAILAVSVYGLSKLW
jgi:manganese transport protein